MSYEDGEALVLTLVQTISGYTAENTSRGKWGILNSGKATKYAILKPGPFERAPQGGLVAESKWNTVIELWHRYVDDGSTATNLENDLTLIINKFDAYAHLGDTTGRVRDSFPRRGDGLQEMWKKNGDGPSWLRLSVYIAWEEETNVNPAE